MIKKIIWMLQPPRSGGTLFCRLLDGHSKILVYPTVFRFPNRIWPKIYKVKNLKGFFNLFRFMILKKFDKVGIKKQSSNVKQIRYPFSFNFKYFQNILKKNFRKVNKFNYLNFFFNTFFLSWKNINQNFLSVKYYFGHSTLENPKKFMININNFFCNTNCYLVVYIIRDPIDWYLSSRYLKNSIKKFKDKKNIDRFFYYYSSMLSQAIQSKKNYNIIFINFEDLIISPKKILTKFCSRIKIKFEKKLLIPSFNGNKFISNSSFNLSSKKIDKRVLKRKRKLSKKELFYLKKYNCEKLFNEAKNFCL